MKEEELTRLEKLHQVRKILRWVVFVVFFVLVIVFMIAGGTLTPFYLPIPDAITVVMAGIFTATWFFGTFALGEIAFEVSDTHRVMLARKSMKKAIGYGIAFLITGILVLQPFLPEITEKLTTTEQNIGYGKYFNITFTPLDAHGFAIAESMEITVQNGHAHILIAESKDFTENYQKESFYTYYNQTLNNTTSGVLSCAKFLTPENLHKEYIIHIAKRDTPDASVRIHITKMVRYDAFNSWGILMVASGVILLIWVPTIFTLKKKFEKGSVVR